MTVMHYMLGQTQPGRLYQSAVSSDSHNLQVLLQGQCQLEPCLVVGALSGTAPSLKALTRLA